MRTSKPSGALKQWACGILLLVTAGCGFQSYKSRLERTSRYFRYLEKLNANVSTNRWSAEGISLRVPRQFQPVAFAPPPKEGERKVPVKQEFLLAPLDTMAGMLGRWKCTVSVGGSSEPHEAYMYVASNVALRETRGSGRTSSESFEENFLKSLYQVVDPRDNQGPQQLPPKKNWKEKQFPEGDGFADPVPYSVFRVNPTAQRLALKGDYDLLIYSHANRGVQVIVMFFIPAKVVTTEKLTEEQRIGMCLQTLKIAGASRSSGGSSKTRRNSPSGGLPF